LSKSIPILVVLLLSFLTEFTLTVQAQTIPTVYVDPALNSCPPEFNFTINITIADVVGLNAWGFKLRWDAGILRLVEVKEGMFLNASGDTYFLVSEFVDHVAVGCGLFDPVSVSGSGVLANVTFKVMASGSSVLDIYDTHLLDINVCEIEHNNADGMFQYLHIPLAFEPETLNVKSGGKWVTIYIEVENVSMIDIESVRLKIRAPTHWEYVSVDPEAPTGIGDYDEDGVPDLMVKFNRDQVIYIIRTEAEIRPEYELLIGATARTFEAYTTITVIGWWV